MLKSVTGRPLILFNLSFEYSVTGRQLILFNLSFEDSMWHKVNF